MSLLEQLVGSTSVLVGLALGLLSLLWWLSTRRPAGAPPGPGFALPVLGHLHLLDKDPRAKFSQFQKQYGDVFSLYMGTRFVVILCGYPIIKEAFIKHADEFSHRPHTFMTDKISKGKGVVFSSGEEFKEQRKTSIEILRKLGMGKNVLAEKIQTEVSYYIRTIANFKGEPRDLQNLTAMSVSNNVLAIVYGERFDYDDEDFKLHISLTQSNMNELGGSTAFVFLPFLEHVPGDPFGGNTVLSYFNSFKSTFIYPQLYRHLDEPEEDTGESTDFIYSYLRQIKRKKEKGIATSLDETQLETILCDLYFAGTDTTSTVIMWSLLFLLHNPHEQDKCYKEIVEVVGTDRLPNIHDRIKMVYVEAFVQETLRMGNVAPLAIYHSTANDITFRGHVIPKDTIVMPLLDSVLFDPDIWGDPEVFRPERFIDADGKLTKPPEFIPFSIGRRSCLGEATARMELFLYISALIQHFQFLPAEPGKLPPLDGLLGITWGPKSYKIRAVGRK